MPANPNRSMYAVLMTLSLILTPAAVAQDLSDPAMDGNWRQTSMLIDGQSPATVVYDGQTVTAMIQMGEPTPAQIVSDIVAGDPGADPAYMTTQMTSVTGEQASNFLSQFIGVPNDTIYKIEGDVMTTAAYGPWMDGGRPDDFEPEDGKMTISWRRTDTPVNPNNAQGLIDNALIGEWQFHSEDSFVAEEGLVTVTSASGQLIGEFEILEWDDNVTPHRMECVCINSDAPQMIGQMQQIIYEVEGGTLRLAWYEEGSERHGEYPASFNSQPGDILLVSEWERDAP